MQDVNSTTLVCRLVRDPELRTTPSGASVGSMRVAFTQSRKNVSGEWEDAAGFIDVSVFGKQAETVARFLAKGRQIVVQGRLDFREWEDSDGKKQSRIQIIANQVQFIGTGEGQGQTNAVAAQSNPVNAPSTDNDPVPF
jgi:single-strand DNA-binding protein